MVVLLNLQITLMSFAMEDEYLVPYHIIIIISTVNDLAIVRFYTTVWSAYIKVITDIGHTQICQTPHATNK